MMIPKFRAKQEIRGKAFYEVIKTARQLFAIHLNAPNLIDKLKRDNASKSKMLDEIDELMHRNEVSDD